MRPSADSLPRIRRYLIAGLACCLLVTVEWGWRGGTLPPARAVVHETAAAAAQLVRTGQGHIPMPAGDLSAHACDLLVMPEGHPWSLMAFWFSGSREAAPDVQIASAYLVRGSDSWSPAHYAVGRQIEIRWHDGRIERSTPEPFDGLECNHLDYYRYLRGETSRPATSLVDSRPFVALNNLAHVSSRIISPFPASLISGVRDEKEQKDYLNVTGMNTACDSFLAHGIWPSTQGWNHPGSEITTPADLSRFEATVRMMATS